jgi:hypothetical protein
MKKLICTVLIAGAVGGAAKAADLPTAKPTEAEPTTPSCFRSVWDYLKSSVKDCPLRYGPITVYATLDGGYGYEQWGTKIGPNTDKPNYAIQKNSGNTHWLWSPNGLSTSTIGVRFAQEVVKDWEILGVAEAGFNPYTLRLINGPQSQADNNPFTLANQRTSFDLARAGTWDNGQAFVGVSNPTYGTLTFGRSVLLSQSAIGAYDPVASFAFSQIGFTAYYATFGASPTSRINTGFTYRLTYQGFRVAAQAQVGGYAQDNAATQQYQAQIGAVQTPSYGPCSQAPPAVAASARPGSTRVPSRSRRRRLRRSRRSRVRRRALVRSGRVPSRRPYRAAASRHAPERRASSLS